MSDAASGDELERDEELGYELHDGPGQLVTAIHLLAHRYADDLPADSPWRSRLFRLVALARQAKWEMDRMARGRTLTVLTEGQANDSVGRLARQFELDSRITVLDQIRGAPSMSKGEAVGLLRIAHQALMNAWQHARCSAVRLEVLLRPGEIVLTVADDGIGLGRRWQSREGRLGMASMRRTAERSRGTLKVGASSPNGVTVEARIPRNS